jgi:branched-chain amino acid transport system permease protein
MVFFAALTYVGLLEAGLSAWLAVPATLIVMIVLALADRASRAAATG